ncbi:nocamycin O-methyltransferase-like [Oscarella lobularis]|uniref:nocamycin O-methyltransferase-like n=1 Tax=Oscarella lobularis TaxID=121494 RepID=UPI003313AACE
MSASNYSRFAQYVQDPDATRFLDHALQPKPGDRVLDFGCGSGNVTVDLARRIGPTGFLVGVDPDEDRVSFAKKRFHNDENVRIVRGSIDEAVEFGPFDVINSTMVLFWISPDKYDAILQKIFDLLVPGGRFGFTTLKDDEPGPRLGYLGQLSANQYENSYEKFLSAVGLNYRSLSYWKECLKRTSFELVHAVEEEREYVLPDDESLLVWWEATCYGRFSAECATRNAEAHETVLRQYGRKRNEPASIVSTYVDVVVRKP